MGQTTGKATTKAKNKYNSKNYDRLNIITKKGNKSIIEEAAKKENKSLNSFVLEAINEKLIKSKSPLILENNKAKEEKQKN